LEVKFYYTTAQNARKTLNSALEGARVDSLTMNPEKRGHPEKGNHGFLSRSVVFLREVNIVDILVVFY